MSWERAAVEQSLKVGELRKTSKQLERRLRRTELIAFISTLLAFALGVMLGFYIL